MDFSVRPAKVDDAESMIELLNPIIQSGTYTRMHEPLTVEDQIDFIRRFPTRGVFHIAMNNVTQEALGLQDVLPLSTKENALRHVGEISTFVSLTAQRSGIGRSLSKATFRAARRQGFVKILATIRADNAQAVSFYQSQGFRTIGTAQEHAFVGGKYIDEILMERFIDDRGEGITG